MKNRYLAVIDNNEKPRVLIVRLDKGEKFKQVAQAFGYDLDGGKVEWMAGEMDMSINI